MNSVQIGQKSYEMPPEPREKYGETLCYMRDPDGYTIEVGTEQAGLHVRLTIGPDGTRI